MESDDRDVEVFERIPWDSLESSPDRRWIAYLVAAAIVVAAIGISIGRGVGGPAVTTQPTLLSAAPTTVGSSSSIAPVPSTIPSTSTTRLLSEADLMAAPAGSLEMAAATMAEWFVIDWFTRDGSQEEKGRSFVEWAGTVETSWKTTTTLEVTVVTRRLAARGEEAYRRLEEEAWVVTTELEDQGWVVAQGPMATEVPSSDWERVQVEGQVPPEVADQVADARAARQTDRGWLVAVEWTDPAGLTWPIHRFVAK